MPQLKKLAGVFALVFALLLGAAPASATAAETQAEISENIGFYVHPQIPENQVHKDLGYFDLKMKPNQNQNLVVDVANESQSELAIDVALISASTNRNGVIDYHTPDVHDATLRTPFSDIATSDAQQITVPAGKTKPVTISVQMPEYTYDGVVLGGIVFTRSNPGKAAGQEGVSIQNRYSYVVGVQLSETDKTVSPDFELLGVEGEVVNHRPATTHYIRNKEAAVVKGLHLEAEIYRKGETEPLMTVEKDDVDMAPNSVMPLAVMPEDGELEPGDYHSKVTLSSEQNSWKLSADFSIDAEEAQQINSAGLPGAGWQIFGPYTVLIGACILVLLALVITLLILLLKRRRKEEEPQKAPIAEDSDKTKT